jgi:diguanylate cyclase (GGDEF)-like protein
MTLVADDTGRHALLGMRMLKRDQPATTLRLEGRRTEQLGREIAALRAVVTELQGQLASMRAREEAAHFLALHDELTALPNRRYFRQQLDQALALATCVSPALAVVYLDLDGFKGLNDTYGHDTGDAVLRIVAARLAHSVRDGDFLTRLGGDEYACLIGGELTQDRLHQLANALFQAIAAPVHMGSLALAVRPSIGIALYPTDGTTAEALVKAADAAMYTAKRKKLRYAFSHPSDREALSAIVNAG